MTVYLVGAGPGDPDLLTLKAAKLLAAADVVVYDRLVGPEILDMIAPWAELVNVGKDPNGKRTTQEQINHILVERGAVHDTVVRLKGGDPFVFGRGGEEAIALENAGIPVVAVPGITSSIAGPAAAGIPVTHRHVSSAFTVVTAHQDPNHDASLNWDALATLGTTLVVLMGARRAAAVRDRLIAGGMDPQTPVAIVVSATTPQQQIHSLPLAELGQAPVPNPAIIVIGQVAADPVINTRQLVDLAGTSTLPSTSTTLQGTIS